MQHSLVQRNIQLISLPTLESFVSATKWSSTDEIMDVAEISKVEPLCMVQTAALG